MRRQLCGAVLVCLALFSTAQGQQPQAPAGSRFMPAEIIVKFRNATPASQRDAIINSRAAGVIRRFNALGQHRVRLRNGQSVESALAAFRALPDVALAQPNYIRRAFRVDPDDPFWQFGFQWGPQKIQAPEVWNTYTTGSPDVVIASLDTGVDYLHTDLAPNMWQNPGEVPGNGLDDDNNGYVDDVYGIDTVNSDTDPMDDQGHGTQTVGIIAMVGNNGVGGVGVTWNSKVLTCKFVDETGSGTDADAIECFNYLVTMKQLGVNIRVSNNSWGSLREDPPALALKDAIDAAGAAGILNVFAAGNDGTDNDILPFDPASFASPSIISVAASDDADNRASFSNYGATSVHIAAPGDFMFTTGPGSTIGFASGTSMAAPMVAGAAALLVANDPTLTVHTLKARLISSVDVLPQWGGVVSSGGRLNVFNAIAFNGNTPPSVSLTSPAPGASFFAPASIPLQADASDSNGTVDKVDFYANGVLVGTDSTGPFTATWPNVGMGNYQLTAVATDDLGATRTSAGVPISVVTPPWRVNVALQANGATAVPSSTLNAQFPAGAAINGDRKGLGWGNGGGWNDGTLNSWPDWLEVRFNGAQTIDEIDVFTIQDDYANPVEPTPTTSFTNSGFRDFTVEYWTGGAWQTVPGGAVTANSLIWRQFAFPPVTTSKIRVSVLQAPDRYSRIAEVEAYTSSVGPNNPPTVAVTSPTAGSSFLVPSNIALEVSAGDTDGTVSRVDFYVNGGLIGSDTAGPSPFTFTWMNAPAGNYSLTAVATDDDGAVKTSAAVAITVTTPPWRVNVALSANGGTAVGSSTLNSNFPASATINGDRKALGWGSGGGWNDGTLNTWPDWLEVRFNGTQTIDEIDVFTVQDDYANPIEPAPATTFNMSGLANFTVEYWNGSVWQTVPDGTVTENTLVWRRFVFQAVTTSKIRVLVQEAPDRYSRIAEVEAYTSSVGPNSAPSVTLTAPANGSSFLQPVTIGLEAAASDSDGTVARVDFYVNGGLIGSDTTGPGPFTFAWPNVPAGNYTLSAVATDDDGAVKTSASVNSSVTTPSWRVNVARSINGGTAVGSSTLNSSFPASAANNGDRKGLGWGNGGGWNDGTLNAWPDWLEVRFNGLQTIEEIDVVTLQDNYSAPVEPTPATTFNLSGLSDFTVEYWNGSVWQTVPGGTVTGNTLVWRQFVFPALTTSKIRVLVQQAPDRYSRITEVEAYTSSVGPNTPPSVTLTAPTNGSSFLQPVTVGLEAAATDSDGTVARVDFYVNGGLIGSDTSGPGPFTFAWANVPAGNYALSAVATDDDGAVKTSASVNISVTTPSWRVNIARSTNGGTAVGSSTLNTNFPASAAINGDRKGLGWGSGGGWNDGTLNAWPDWLEVRFNGLQTIEEIDVFTLQDNYASPVEPTPTTTFNLSGIANFAVEYWNGSAWQAVPNGTVTGNTLVWRQFVFPALTTSKIRVLVQQAPDRYSRITEVEAYTSSVGPNAPPNVALTAPANGSSFQMPVSVSLEATATDPAGSVSQVDFYVNGALVGADMSGPSPFSFTWQNVQPGSYSVTAVATDNLGALRTSSAVTFTVTNPPWRVNVARATNGGTVVASSTLNANFPATATINGDRKGQGWGSGGGWNDGTLNTWPDWLEVRFNGSQTINEINVFTLQDNYASPVEPTPTTTFNLSGIANFTVEYWTGTDWQAVPNGVVTGNNLIWRQFVFPAVTTSKIRVLVQQAPDRYSRITEVEAFTAPPGG